MLQDLERLRTDQLVDKLDEQVLLVFEVINVLLKLAGLQRIDCCRLLLLHAVELKALADLADGHEAVEGDIDKSLIKLHEVLDLLLYCRLDCSRLATNLARNDFKTLQQVESFLDILCSLKIVQVLECFCDLVEFFQRKELVLKFIMNAFLLVAGDHFFELHHDTRLHFFVDCRLDLSARLREIKRLVIRYLLILDVKEFLEDTLMIFDLVE